MFTCLAPVGARCGSRGALSDMGRRPREDEAGAIHHVFARGNNRQAIFEDDLDRATYLRLLGEAVGRTGWRCLSFCLMPNHVHLLLETPHANLGAGMCRLQGQYARRFNRRHRRSGHLFQGRYGSARVRDDAQLWMVIAYIARNPVASRLCKRPDEWPWGSHAPIVNGTPQPGWLDVGRLLAVVSAITGAPATDAYRRCVDGN
ncbi:MAG TPA: transposase [Solirubrobacteraceae bacterium]|nr:transposase [Solirubrobacteraceae bacterium]